MGNYEKSQEYVVQYILTAVEEKEYDRLLDFIIFLTDLYFKVEKYDNVIKIYKYIKRYLKYVCKNKSETIISLYLKLASAYIHTNKIEEALAIIRMLKEKNGLDNNESIEIKALEADYYFKVKDYANANAIYLQILYDYDDNPCSHVVISALMNLALINYILKNLKEAKKYIDLALNIKNMKEPYIEAKIYEYSVYIYTEMKHIKKAEELLEICIKKSFQCQKEHIQVNVIDYMSNHYIESNNYLCILKLANILEELSCKGFIVSSKVVYVFLKIYAQIKEQSILTSIFQKCLSIVKNCEEKKFVKYK
ncbi:tetratricopeptide repeat protein [Clostridium tagluense]|uniref:tetratricopeptide repeat protein n=1 Tax=Clostridium tagluense TaxID=360422 RepID=UPI001C6E9B5E|nr:hypothetical protein [Clostridium tagluense]MBW9159354.1 hypothetical protein [Clostridium tagluense]WLC68071.1 hypothetical protein KTC93_24150 [Clostridium tagluense]